MGQFLAHFHSIVYSYFLKFFKYEDSSLGVRGSGRKSFSLEFGHFIKKNQFDIIFIYESKLPKCKQEAFWRRSDSLLSFFFVPSEGCWKKNISTTILQATKNFIHGWIVDPLTHKFFNFCGIYGSPDYNSKLFVMRNIINLISDEPWLLCGDFNLALKPKETSGGLWPRTFQREVKVLWDHSHMIDLGFIGEKFTCSNLQEDHDRIFARLDRVATKAQWISFFPYSRVYHLDPWLLDHFSICNDPPKPTWLLPKIYIL